MSWIAHGIHDPSLDQKECRAPPISAALRPGAACLPDREFDGFHFADLDVHLGGEVFFQERFDAGVEAQ